MSDGELKKQIENNLQLYLYDYGVWRKQDSIAKILDNAKKEFPGPVLLQVERSKKLGLYTEINYSKEAIDIWLKKWFGGTP
jgi:hypothetical protein